MAHTRKMNLSLLSTLLLWTCLLYGTLSHEVNFRLRRSRTKSAAEAGGTSLSTLFARNHRAHFSWENPELKHRLWAGIEGADSKSAQRQTGFGKRAPEDRIVLPPALRQRHCLGCAKAAIGEKAMIENLNTEWLETQLLKTNAQLRDRCVFYTGVTKDEHPAWIPPRKGLSSHATEFACRYGLYTIWNLFPGQSGNQGAVTEPDNPARYNFWEIEHDGSWLNAIYKDRFEYFENMSEAMTRHCEGKVWVVSFQPRATTTYGTGSDDNNNAHSIWNKKELPALRAYGPVEELIGVHATGPNGQVGKMWRLDISTPDLASLGEYTGPIPRDLEHLLIARDTCTANLAYEPDGEDWFGTGRSA